MNVILNSIFYETISSNLIFFVIQQRRNKSYTSSNQYNDKYLFMRIAFYLYANETNVGKIQQMSGKIVFMIDDAKFNYSPLD